MKPHDIVEQNQAIQPQMVTVEIEGKRFQVPAGITLMLSGIRGRM